MPQDTPKPELSETAAELSKLAPAASRVNRDRLMYEAGFAAGRSSARAGPGRAWPSIAAALAVAVVAESAALAVRREPRVIVVERTIPQLEQVPAAPSRTEVLAESAPSHPVPIREDHGEPVWPLRLRRLAVPSVEDLPEPTPLLSRSEAAAGGGLDRSGDASLRRLNTPQFLESGGPS